MCRYAFNNYKSHFACFSCRKTFKKTMIEDWVKQKGIDLAFKRLLRSSGKKAQKQAETEFNTTYNEIRDAYLNDVAACPQCGENMAAMGLDFKAPKHKDLEQWKIISILYDNGFAFHGCGCDVGYSPPKKVSELKEFFLQHKRVSEREKLLKLIASNN